MPEESALLSMGNEVVLGTKFPYKKKSRPAGNRTTFFTEWTRMDQSITPNVVMKSLYVIKSRNPAGHTNTMRTVFSVYL